MVGVGSENNEINGLSFEEGISQLDRLVQSLETGEIPLESLVSQYETGMNLLKHCRSKLEHAELKVSSFQPSSDHSDSGPKND